MKSRPTVAALLLCLFLPLGILAQSGGTGGEEEPTVNGVEAARAKDEKG